MVGLEKVLASNPNGQGHTLQVDSDDCPQFVYSLHFHKDYEVENGLIFP